MALGVVQLSVGFIGIEHHLGAIWAWVAIAAAFGLRFLLPLTIGTYFGAVDVLGWPWYAGLLLAAPGLLFVVPGAIAAAIQSFRGR